MPRSRRSTRKASNSKSATALGLALITVAVAVLAVGGYLYLFGKDKVDANGCLASKKPPLKLVILIDVSSRFSADQVEALKGYTEYLFETIPRYTEVSVYRLVDRPVREGDRVIKVCSPGNPKDVNHWTDNQKLVKRRWDAEFKGQIETQVREISAAAGGSSSPILESIRTISLLEFKLDNAETTKLAVISDFVENSDLLNMYRGGGAPDYAAFKRTSGYQYSLARLENVEADFMVLETASSIQQQASFQKFWETYLIENGASKTRFKSILRYGR